MKKQYVLINPEVVTELGLDKLRELINAGKYELERDIAAFIYYSCLAVTEGGASYADISAAFNCREVPSMEGFITMKYESLIRHFYIIIEEEDVVELKFNPAYKDDYFGYEARIRNTNLRKFQ